MTITTTYQPGNTVWFINIYTLEPISGVINNTYCTVNSGLVQVKTHNIIVSGNTFAVEDVHCFASQAALGTYYTTS